MPAPLPVEVAGVSHVAGKYHLTDEDFLNEGGNALHELGCGVIKVWLTDLARKYPFNSAWPEMKTLVEMAASPYFKKLLDKPFQTFILETFRPGRKDDYWLAGMTPQDAEAESTEIAELTKHLIDTYADSGKTFVLQNWEGDWALRGGAPGTDPKPPAVKGMIDWLNARQAGVERARTAAGERNVNVLHAAEVNHVARAMKKDGVTVTNDVLPHTKCDLYSYSAWDVPTHEPEKFKAALDYLASKAPGEDNVYVGEYGAPENVVGGREEQDRRVRSATETAMGWGAKYIVYWQLYCNELAEGVQKPADPPRRKDLRGFWLIRPDGTRPPVTDYFIDLWNRR